jgi:MFS transporter, DHA2 family, methylenomycin A resistance protein
MVHSAVAPPPPHTTRRTDLGGTILGILAMGGLCAACIGWGQRGAASPWSTVPLLIGVAASVAFWQLEGRLADPMLPLRLFRRAGFTAALVLGLLFNLCAYGTLLCLSLYLQHQVGLRPLTAGLAMLPFTVTIGAGSIASGRLTAWLRPRRPMVAGMVCGLAGVLIMAGASAAGSLPVLVAGSVLFGCCSLSVPAMTAVALGAAGRADAGLAGGVLNAARQGGGALGVALLGAVLARSQQVTGQLWLPAPLLLAAAGYLLAIGAAWLAGSRAGTGAA